MITRPLQLPPVQSAPVLLTAAGLSIHDLARLARAEAVLAIDNEVWARVRAARGVVEGALARGDLVYGLTSGLGHHRDERLSADQLLAYQEQIIVAHAAGVGPPIPDEDVRAVMVARAAGIAAGGCSAHPEALGTLVAMLNGGVHPLVPEIGSVGASDLMHMAAVARAMTGRGRVRYRGESLPAAQALAAAGIPPYQLRPGDALALISANGASIGLGALTVLYAERVALLADLVGALTLEAAGAGLDPFDAEVVAAKPFTGQIEVAARIRTALRGSYLWHTGALSLQDPLSLRVIPQVHGAFAEQVAFARRSVEIELNAIDDNPLVSVARGRMLASGNFHPMVLALAFDALRLGIAHVGMLSERRMNKVADFSFGTPEMLLTPDADHPGATFGETGVLAYTAAALLSQLKHAATPATLSCPPLDHDVEDHATLAPQAVSLTRQALDHLETILVIECILAVDRLAGLPEALSLGAGTAPVFHEVQAILAERPAGEAGDAVEAVRFVLRRRIAPAAA